MDINEALKIVEALADGLDPGSGEALPNESCLNDPQVVRALHAAREALRNSIKAANRKSDLPTNAGNSWSKSEEEQLAKSFDNGITVEQLAIDHRRTKGAIAARLVRVGKITKRHEVYVREHDETKT